MIIYATGGKIGKWEKSFPTAKLTTEILLKRTFRKSIYNQTEILCAVAKTENSRVDSPPALKKCFKLITTRPRKINLKVITREYILGTNHMLTSKHAYFSYDH